MIGGIGKIDLDTVSSTQAAEIICDHTWIILKRDVTYVHGWLTLCLALESVSDKSQIIVEFRSHHRDFVFLYTLDTRGGIYGGDTVVFSYTEHGRSATGTQERAEDYLQPVQQQLD